MEIAEAADIIKDEVDDDANIIFGSSYDNSLEGKIRVSYFKFKAHVLKPTGRQAINQAFHKLMIITFQTRMSANVISQEQTVLMVPLICLTIGLGKEPGKNNILCGCVIKLCVLS